MDLDTKLTNIHDSINESAKDSLKAIGALNTKMGIMEKSAELRQEAYEKEMKGVRWQAVQDQTECKRRGAAAHTALDKVSRLEDVDKSRKKWFRLGIATIFALAIKQGWEFMFGPK